MWENTVKIAINPEFSKNLIERIKQNIIPELKRTEGKGDQYVVDASMLLAGGVIDIPEGSQGFGHISLC